MALTIPQILRQFKTDVAKALHGDTIGTICSCLGHVCRKRVLDPVNTVHVFLLQIFHGNTACSALSRLEGLTFSATAYCAARKRLPLALFEELLLGSVGRVQQAQEQTEVAGQGPVRRLAGNAAAARTALRSPAAH